MMLNDAEFEFGTGRVGEMKAFPTTTAFARPHLNTARVMSVQEVAGALELA